MRPKSEYNLKVADVEVGGDIHRIVLGGVDVPPHLKTASDVRLFFLEEMDLFRQLLISYPYGHKDMCVDFLFPSHREDVENAYVIMECMGYPYFSGSNTIATVAALHEYGMLGHQNNGSSTVFLEAPIGKVSASSRIVDGKVEAVTVNGGATYVLQEAENITVPGIGNIAYSLVWSGDYFVVIDAPLLGIEVTEPYIHSMKELGRRIIEAFQQMFDFVHPELGAIHPPGFIHFMGDSEQLEEKYYRGYGATFGYPDTLWHCPTGTGTAARMALMKARGEINVGDTFESVSPRNNAFTGCILQEEEKVGYHMLEIKITARPYILTTLDLHLDFNNPLMKKYSAIRKILS